MKKMMKRFLPVMLAVCLCVALSVTAYANARYIYNISTYNSLDINGDVATMYSDFDCSGTVTQVSVTHVLQKKSGSSYSTVPGTSRSKTFYSSVSSFESDVACASPGTYRVKTTYKVTGPQGTETHTKTSASVTR